VKGPQTGPWPLEIISRAGARERDRGARDVVSGKEGDRRRDMDVDVEAEAVVSHATGVLVFWNRAGGHLNEDMSESKVDA